MKCKVSSMTAIMAVVAAVLIIPAGGTVFAQTTGSIEVVQNPNGPIADDFDVTVPNGGFDPITIDFKPHIRDNGTDTAVGDLTVRLESVSSGTALLQIVGGSIGPNDGTDILSTLAKPNQTLTLDADTISAYTGGSYTYTYSVTDQQNLTDTGLLGITVEPIEIFARLQNQSYAIYQNTELVVSVSDMIDRNQIYTWPKNLRDSAEIVNVGSPTNGMTENNSTSFTYTPNMDFDGDDSFLITVQITDGSQTYTRDATVAVHVVLQICSTSVTGSLDFGPLYDGQESDDQTITVSNTGNVPNAITISGEDWLAGSDRIMEIGTTKYSTTSGTDYSAKTVLTDIETDVVRLVNGTGTGTDTSIHMQVQLNLLDPTFTGNIQQTVTVGSNCSVSP